MHNFENCRYLKTHTIQDIVNVIHGDDWIMFISSLTIYDWKR